MAVEPVFLLRRDLPSGDGSRHDTLELCLAAERVGGAETIFGAQEIRGLWRVYPLTRTARNVLLIEGITLRQQTVQVHDKNPVILRGGSGEEMPVTKVWISDIPISCEGKDIETALVFQSFSDTTSNGLQCRAYGFEQSLRILLVQCITSVWRVCVCQKS